MMQIVRVNVRTGKITETPVSGEQAHYGGRRLIAKVLTQEVSPICDPLGRYNKLIFAPGWLGGTAVTTSGRLSIGAKSPLTGGVKESNVGGEAGQKLARLGIRALILEDVPEEVGLRIVHVDRGGIRFAKGTHLSGHTVSETFTILREQYGDSIGLLVIGPAGEMRMTAAGVATTDREGIQIRYAARGGLGSVMGSKGIKAIVIDDAGTTNDAGHYPDRFKETAKRFTDLLLASPKIEGRRKYGTAGIVARANELGLLPTRNFSAGSFEEIDSITGARLAELIAERGGEGRSGTACMSGCVIRCSNVFPDADGKRKVASLQYENIALLGSNCGIGSLDGIATLNALCNEIGLDAIEMGGVLGVAMEAGLIPFGDVEGASGLLREIQDRTPLGRILGQGVTFAGQALGVRRIPAVNGQGIPGYDPRALKGNGVTYVTSPMGADHTAGNAFGTAGTIDPLVKEGQLKNSRGLQIRAMILDMSGLCLFARGPFVESPGLLADLLNARFGWDISFPEIVAMAVDTLETERAFNDRAGVSDRFADVPEFMRVEPLPPHGTVYDLTNEEMQAIWKIEPETSRF